MIDFKQDLSRMTNIYCIESHCPSGRQSCIVFGNHEQSMNRFDNFFLFLYGQYDADNKTSTQHPLWYRFLLQ